MLLNMGSILSTSVMVMMKLQNDEEEDDVSSYDVFSVLTTWVPYSSTVATSIDQVRKLRQKEAE
jgi:hypothetical protein